MLENSVLRRIFEPKRQRERREAGEDCRLRNLYTLPNIVRVTTSRRMR
jgi:hypothetical protein